MEYAWTRIQQRLKQKEPDDKPNKRGLCGNIVRREFLKEPDNSPGYQRDCGIPKPGWSVHRQLGLSSERENHNRNCRKSKSDRLDRPESFSQDQYGENDCDH